MFKIQFILTLCSISQAAYINRIGNGNRIRSPTPFRPGVAMHRTWTHPRVIHAASNRAPYILYRTPPNRYPTKQYQLPSRHLYNGPWKTTGRLPHLSISTPEYEFMRAASAPPVSHGAIHTIPAPNLSLSEKPIVVLDSSIGIVSNAASEASKPVYEVTEKYAEAVYPMPKLERPIGFSKASTLTTPKLQSLIGSGAPFQLSSDYTLSNVNFQQSPEVSQQYTIQGFTGLPTPQDLRDAGAEGIIIPPNALYQSDPMFVQKLQSQLLQQFPAVEFIPYAADTAKVQLQPSTSYQHQPITPYQHQPITSYQHQPISSYQHQPIPSYQHQPIILLDEEDLKQEPSSFIPSVEKNVAQRQTEGSDVVNGKPTFTVSNNTENPLEIISEPNNVTTELVTTDMKLTTKTDKYIVKNKTEEQTTPLSYAQVGDAIGSLVAKSFYAAINEPLNNIVKETEEGQPQTSSIAKVETITTTTAVPELEINKQNIAKNKTTTKSISNNIVAKEITSVNVSYDLFRDAYKQPKVLHAMLNNNGKEEKNLKDKPIYAGQIVKATISEDHDFNKQKATLLLKRAPIRLLALSDVNAISAGVSNAPLSNAETKLGVGKTKNLPKSKSTFDNKTGEPILRIYASYGNTPINSKGKDNAKSERVVSSISEAADEEIQTTVKSEDKTQGFEGNQVPTFGLKLRLRRNDYIPIFDALDK